ncbi:MAG: geranylgeranylglycerol-phosphate geranylgeranyltransferase [Candidatus Lokiarchaeota archaeon]|nr:geranylgeranylglycerol-phosphate geranylgeranyltransferase [Candidatus Lokiarchaeota archaeon]
MKLKAAIEITRPINDVIGCLTVIIGLLNTRRSIPTIDLILNLILGAITYFLIASSGMIINDIFDLEIDRINRPTRPIPRGDITLKEAKILFISTFALGIIIAIINSIMLNLGFLNIIIAIFFGFIGWLYAAWGKKSGFLGNIIVSISFSIGLIYGAVLNGSSIPIYIYYFFLTSFFLLLAREIVKGCEDIEGDKKEGVRTLAILLNIRKALYISIMFDIFAIIFFILPIFTDIINLFTFFISMSFGLAIVIIATLFSLRSKLENHEFKKISLLLKIGAFLGLVAFIFASI